MAKRQTRRSISVSRSTYERLRAYCETNGISMSQFVEHRVGDFLGRSIRRPAGQGAPLTPDGLNSLDDRREVSVAVQSAPAAPVTPVMAPSSASLPAVSEPNVRPAPAAVAPAPSSSPSQPRPVALSSAATASAPARTAIVPRPAAPAPPPAKLTPDQIFTF